MRYSPRPGFNFKKYHFHLLRSSVKLYSPSGINSRDFVYIMPPLLFMPKPPKLAIQPTGRRKNTRPCRTNRTVQIPANVTDFLLLEFMQEVATMVLKALPQI